MSRTPKMTKVHFQFIADHFKAHYENNLKRAQYVEAHALEMLARGFGESLKVTNPNFDRDKFIHACGMEVKG